MIGYYIVKNNNFSNNFEKEVTPHSNNRGFQLKPFIFYDPSESTQNLCNDGVFSLIHDSLATGLIN